MAVLEGVMGYYDGLGGTSDRASSYEVAAAGHTGGAGGARPVSYTHLLCKPLRSFGKLEEAVVRVAGIQGTIQPDISRPAVVIMGADNGVVEEGVSQSGSEGAAQVLENMGAGISAVCILARQFGAPVYPVNIGMKTEGKHPRIRNCRVRPGTGNIAVEPAMTREEGAKAILTGLSVMKELKEEGRNLVITGEMGIGNTTTSSAMAAVFLHRSVSRCV